MSFNTDFLRADEQKVSKLFFLLVKACLVLSPWGFLPSGPVLCHPQDEALAQHSLEIVALIFISLMRGGEAGFERVKYWLPVGRH